jgi:excisionase family DNA binding protein
MKNIQQFDSGGFGEILYTAAEVRAILRISEPTLWRKCKFEGLKKVKMGGLVRFRKSVLEKWISDHESAEGSD